MPVSLGLSFDERHLLPRSAQLLSPVLLPLVWNESVASGPLLPPDLHTLVASHTTAFKMPTFIDQPTFFPRSLTDLALNCYTAIDFSYLPMTISSLKIHTMKPTFETITWEPVALYTFHYTTTKFWTTDRVEGIRTPVFDWIYTQKAIANLKLVATNASATRHESAGTRFNLARLPPSVQFLKLQGGSTGPHSMPLPSNLPEHLISLSIKSGLDSLVEYIPFPPDMSEFEILPHRSPFLEMKKITLAFPFWRLPSPQIFAPHKLTKMVLIGLLSTELCELEFLQSLPQTLQTLVLKERRQTENVSTIGNMIPLLPSSLTSLAIYHHNIFLNKPPSWPAKLSNFYAPHCETWFSGIKGIPICLIRLVLKRVQIEAHNPRVLEELQVWMDERPHAELHCAWILPREFLPHGVHAYNPLLLHRALATLEAFKHSNWLTHMNWISEELKPFGQPR
jgi:hypothetical protein